MSDALDRYLDLMGQWEAIKSNHQPDDDILCEMDDAWWELTDGEKLSFSQDVHCPHCGSHRWMSESEYFPEAYDGPRARCLNCERTFDI